jgi:hypothetical protein
VWIAVVAALLVADATDRQTKVVPLPDGRPLVIEITIGSVRIEGWDRQEEAQITVERRAPSAAQFARLPISIEEVPPGVVVRGLQKDGTTDPAFRSDVTVRLPRSATIERVNVLEGRITIEGLNGKVTADVQRGSIDGRNLSGTLRLAAGSGSVTLANTRLSADGLLRLRSFNGDVTLTLAERPADARILVLALNGHIKSDIPLTRREAWGPRWGEATLGKGEPVISIDVVTGTIDIKSP